MYIYIQSLTGYKRVGFSIAAICLINVSATNTCGDIKAVIKMITNTLLEKVVGVSLCARLHRQSVTYCGLWTQFYINCRRPIIFIGRISVVAEVSTCNCSCGIVIVFVVVVAVVFTPPPPL